jgi:hypothetical protein
MFKPTRKRIDVDAAHPADSPARLAGSEMEVALLAFGLLCLSGRTDGHAPEGPVQPVTPSETVDPKKIG